MSVSGERVGCEHGCSCSCSCVGFRQGSDRVECMKAGFSLSVEIVS